MTEDSTNILAFNKSIALAEQDVPNSNMTQIVQSIAEPGFKSETPLFSASSYTGITKYFVHNIDISSKEWQSFELGDYQNFDIDASSLTFDTAYSILDIPMYAMYGENDADDTGIATTPSTGITGYKWTTGDQQAGQYVYSKLQSVELALTNFMITVERDTSGGVQMMDNVIFQVGHSPATMDLGDQGQVEDTLLTPQVYTTDLKNGLKQRYDVNCGWGRVSDAWFRVTPSSAPTTSICAYWTLREWINRSGATPVDPRLATVLSTLNDTRGSVTNIAYPRFINVAEPAEVLYYRAMNLPAASNIKVFLSYEVELKTHWMMKYKFVLQYFNELPTLGANLTDVTERRNAKKRRRLN